MIVRRKLLFASTALATSGAITLPATAFIPAIPAIITTIGAVTALATAVAAAAAAINKAIEQGALLHRQIESQMERRTAEAVILRVTSQAQQAIGDGMGSVVNQLYAYSRNPEPEQWQRIVNKMSRAISSVEEIARMFRVESTWFPPNAQRELADLANHFEIGGGIMLEIQKLAAIEPPTEGEALERLQSLAKQLDDLRVKCLELAGKLQVYAKA